MGSRLNRGRAGMRGWIGRGGIAAVLGLLVWMHGAGGALAAATFGAETFTLANGMQFVVIPNHRAPVVHHSIWYRVGAADEPPGKSGLAHMLEHMMFKGTDSVEDGAFSKIIARNGGNDNAFTSQDYTGYYQNIASDRLELVMNLEADRMVNLSFTAESFETERDVVLEERRTRVDNRPRARFSEQMQATLFMSHPYRLPIIGWEHEIRAFSREDALDFYRTYYAPNNAILIVAGDVTADELKPMAERIFGDIPPSDIGPRVRPQEPPHLAHRRVQMTDTQAANVEWNRGYLAPCYHCGDITMTMAVDLLADILGGGSTSRLYQSLVVKQQLADYAGAFFDGVTYDQTRFLIYASVRDGTEIEQIEEAVEAEIERLLTDGITQEEFERSKFGTRAQAMFARDNLATMARIFGVALTSGMEVEDVERWLEDLDALTLDDVMAAAPKILRQATAVTGVLRPGDSDRGRDEQS